MELNLECVRDTLLYLEENLSYKTDSNYEIEHKSISIGKIASDMNDLYSYDKDTVYYTVEKLLEARFINSDISTFNGKNLIFCTIYDITYNGHMFLGTIRPKTIWKAMSEKARQLGGISLQGLSIIGTAVMQGLASNPDFIQSIVNLMNQS